MENKIKNSTEILSSEFEINEYNIGDIVPYINNMGNLRKAKISSFETHKKNGKIWFHGINIKTKANVYFPVQISLMLRNHQ